MICGGTNIITNPDFTSGLDRGYFLSRTGNCKTFDDTADGYCRGEGVASVVLKRLDDAVIDNDPILGVILNTSTNHSAESESITRPYCHAQKSLFRKVLGPLNPATVSYVEMHGTGTQVGDAIEMKSVLNSFAPEIAPTRRAEHCPLHIGSVKPNVGHGEAAAGVTSLIKVLLMLQHNTIPPHCGIKTEINRNFPADLPSRGVYIAEQAREWRTTLGVPRRAVVNSFSAAGGNTALLLQESQDITIERGEDPRKYHLVAVSAKSLIALKANARSLLYFIDHTSSVDVPLASLSYTTTARRVHHENRICVYGCTNNEVTQAISNDIELQVDKDTLRDPKIVFAFTGQGSCYFGMGKVLYNDVASFRGDIRRYDRIALDQGFPSILHIVTQDQGQNTVSSPVASQLAVSCLQMALVRMWRGWGIEPQAVIGHSLGHYAALNAAGVLSEVDVVFLVGRRAQLVNISCAPETHCMLAAELSEDETAPFLTSSKVEISCLNGPTQVVVGGLRSEIEELRSILASKSIRSTLLHTTHAYHTSQMDCVLQDFEQATGGSKFRRPSIPVICSLNAAVIDEKKHFNPSYLANHLRKPVKFYEALTFAKDTSIITSSTIFLQIGPSPTLRRMIRDCLGDNTNVLASLDPSVETWKTLARTLASLYKSGAEVNWMEYHRFFPQAQQVVALPSYAWDLSSHWIEYKNDWSLRKGDPPPKPSRQESSILSTTVHEVAEEKFGTEGASITVNTDLCRPDLSTILQGHKVNGLALCTPVGIPISF